MSIFKIPCERGEEALVNIIVGFGIKSRLTILANISLLQEKEAFPRSECSQDVCVANGASACVCVRVFVWER